jgi:hypothetical protein
VTPDLATRLDSAIHYDDLKSAFGRTGRGFNSSWTSSDYNDVGRDDFRRSLNAWRRHEFPSVRMCIPSTMGMRHARWLGLLSIVTLHSKQTPMQHTGPRDPPETDCRKDDNSRLNNAAATVIPAAA